MVEILGTQKAAGWNSVWTREQHGCDAAILLGVGFNKTRMPNVVISKQPGETAPSAWPSPPVMDSKDQVASSTALARCSHPAECGVSDKRVGPGQKQQGSRGGSEPVLLCAWKQCLTCSDCRAYMLQHYYLLLLGPRNVEPSRLTVLCLLK